MRHGNWITVALLVCLMGGAGVVSSVSAQDAGGEIKQMLLTEEQIKNLISAQPDLAQVAKKLEGLPEDAEVSVEKELDAIATKHGFKDFTDLDNVSANVQLVLDGIDPETGEYQDPIEGLKEELAEVKADENLQAEEKSALIAELEEAVSTIPPLKHKENIELVRKHNKAIQHALDAAEGGG